MKSSRAPLATLYLVTPEPGARFAEFVRQLENSLAAGIRLVQFRAKTLDPASYKELATDVLACCRRHDALLLLNAAPELVDELGADGVHLDGTRLAACRNRPLAPDKLVCAACHTVEQLRQAEAIYADMVTLSPVLATASHPDGEPLGWKGFADLAKHTRLPVYALGGMSRQLLACAQENGAYGVAGIHAFWDGLRFH
ncbi:MAG: thiamine monophosphate synthase/TENI family protein [Herbaspirillum sp.]|nr:thiamine monophosphate synthase/TENI family protein [Herbaspirillum sp.]